MNYPRRIARAAFGLFIFGCGSCFNIQANIGYGAWEAFSIGVGAKLGLSFGTVLQGSGVVILLIDLLLREKIGLGTLLDIYIVGATADLLWNPMFCNSSFQPPAIWAKGFFPMNSGTISAFTNAATTTFPKMPPMAPKMPPYRPPWAYVRKLSTFMGRFSFSLI